MNLTRDWVGIQRVWVRHQSLLSFLLSLPETAAKRPLKLAFFFFYCYLRAPLLQLPHELQAVTTLHCAITPLTFSEFCPAHFCSCSLQRAPDDPSAPAWVQSRTPKLPIAHKLIKDVTCSRHKQKDTGKSEMMPETTFFYALVSWRVLAEDWWDASPCTGNSSVC